MTALFSSDRPTQALIDGGAFLRNLRKLRAVAENDFFCPMIKANAYGHGAILMYDLLTAEKIEVCGVALLEEARELRAHRADGPRVFIFSAVRPDHYEEVARSQFTLVIGSLEELKSAAASQCRLSLHLKFDTGMHRRGLSADEVCAARAILQRNPHLHLSGLCTHFFLAEDGLAKNSPASGQLKVFEQIVSEFPGEDLQVHSLNSIAAWNLRHFPHVYPAKLLGMRPGLFLYGGHPDFESVLSLRSKIVQTRIVQAGQGVSYGWTWTAPRTSIVGVVPLGYADGFSRRLGPHVVATLAGREVHVIGTVCMDLLLVDLTGHAFSANELCEEITFFGRDPYGKLLPVETIAAKGGTIPWEILTQIGPRVPRVLI